MENVYMQTALSGLMDRLKWDSSWRRDNKEWLLLNAYPYVEIQNTFSYHGRVDDDLSYVVHDVGYKKGSQVSVHLVAVKYGGESFLEQLHYHVFIECEGQSIHVTSTLNVMTEEERRDFIKMVSNATDGKGLVKNVTEDTPYDDEEIPF